MTMYGTTLRSLAILSVAGLMVGCGEVAQDPPAEPAPGPAAQVPAEYAEEFAALSPADQAAAAAQEICPVSGQPLGSMGTPVKVTVEGREVFLCCAGCEPAITQDPEKYFAVLDGEAGHDGLEHP